MLSDRLGRGSPLMDALRAQTLSGAPPAGAGTSSVVTGASFLTLALDAGLAAERLFTPGAGLGAVDGGANGAYTLGVDATVARSTWAIIAGLGLVTGGNLSAGGTTLDVGAGTGITVNANDVAVNQNFAFAWTGLQTWSQLATFNAGARIAAGQSLDFGTDVSLSRKAADILQISAGDDFETLTYTSGFQGWHLDGDGSAEFNNITARGEFHTAVLVYGEVHATAGTFGVFKSAGKLRADLTTVTTPATASMDIEDPDVAHAQLFAINDYVRLKDGSGADNWLKVTAVSDQGTFFRYTVDKQSGSNTTFRAGAAVADYGPSGAGNITLSADGTFGSAANISIATHAGAPWTTQTVRARLGNLNGAYGMASNTYGIGLGDYSGGNYLVYEPTAGFVMKTGNGNVTLDANGISLNFSSVANYLRWMNGSTVVSTQHANDNASDVTHTLSVIGNVTNVRGNVELVAGNNAASASALFQLRTPTGAGGYATLGNSTPLGGTFLGLTIGASGVSPSAMLDVRGDGIVTGGLNIGSATGAGTGAIYASNLFYVKADGLGNGFFAGAGADVQLYRSAADTWRTPDSLTVDVGLNVGTATGAGAGQISVSSTSSTFSMYATSAAANNKIWDFINTGTSLAIRAVNDAYSAAATAINMGRSGTTSTTIGFLGAAAVAQQASGGAVTPGAGAFGASSAVNFAALVTLVQNIRTGLINLGLFS